MSLYLKADRKRADAPPGLTREATGLGSSGSGTKYPDGALIECDRGCIELSLRRQ
ncbi:hypothetical protein OG883_45945 [Streptomyces sp. NBC_01142]|uniref:hypothetical protein n=1 Tax=Streptomyces sp. NBC_01142 TaxID=2975865 RepID=UPI002258C3AD|nr:hypothetical protein [Streptomyces sp. NBC_01142]MCX4818318.1 hypothetical protein [Streptomyces sp. NBC_01142]MCX4824782.1 hypothetical protein [Streptomyces sp. NBC_01142]MCX4826983.1 hypothetical protein [Streptomyces sp. NBC_01142]